MSVILQEGSKGKLLQEGSKGEKVIHLKTNSASLLQNVRTRRTRTPRPHETAIFVETHPTLHPTTTHTFLYCNAALIGAQRLYGPANLTALRPTSNWSETFCTACGKK